MIVWDVLRKDFYFDLPACLVAQYPPEKRGESRLMVLGKETGSVTHSRMAELASYIPRGALMVFNDTRVRKARVYAVCVQPSGGTFRAELLFVSDVHQRKEVFPLRCASAEWKIMCKKARRVQPGSRFIFADGREAVVTHNASFECTEFRQIVFDAPVDEAWFEANGHVPLPPYIKRGDEPEDASRYQTVYAARTGSIAAPTAGLHFTPRILSNLAGAGIETARVTLHVGLGTFLPVRAEHIEDHVMHEDWFSVPPETADAVNAAKQAGRKIVAAGTTVARTLEAACNGAGIAAGDGATNIFIRPGYRFKTVEALFTNFHTPESTLLMLVCAFAGKEKIFAAYAEAVKERYRFFSYGDAMLII